MRGEYVPTQECPCKGTRGPWWHRVNKVAVCVHAADIRKAQRKTSTADYRHRTEQARILQRSLEPMHDNGWREGTAIYLDEWEEMA